MKLNLEKTGLDMVFREYEQIVITELFKGSESTVFKDGKCGSAIAWRYCNEVLAERDHGTISRASIIFFLNRLVDEGLVDWLDRTGKGGHHRIYYSNGDVDYFWRHVMKKTYLRLVEASGDPVFIRDLSREVEG